MYPKGGVRKIKYSPYIAQDRTNLTLLVLILGILSLISIGIMALGVLRQLYPQVAASINKQLNYQGKLQDDSGITVPDDTYYMKFSIYSTDAGGTPLWTECGTVGSPTARTVSVLNGVFSVLLGNISSGACPGGANSNAINLDFNSDTYYLGLTICYPGATDCDPEMTPRKRLGAAGYAFNADLLDGFDTSQAGGSNAFVPVTDSSGNLILTQNFTVDSGVLFVDAANNRVGINNGAPSYTLDIISTEEKAVSAETSFAGGLAVYGNATDTTAAANIGGFFESQGIGDGASGIRAYAYGASGATYGVYGYAASSSGWSGYFTGGKGLYTDNDLFVGATAHTLSNANFTMDGSGAGFFADQLGSEGSVYTDTSFIVGASTTYGDGSITTSSGDLTIAPNGEDVFITGNLDVSKHLALATNASVDSLKILNADETYSGGPLNTEPNYYYGIYNNVTGQVDPGTCNGGKPHTCQLDYYNQYNQITTNGSYAPSSVRGLYQGVTLGGSDANPDGLTLSGIDVNVWQNSSTGTASAYGITSYITEGGLGGTIDIAYAGLFTATSADTNYGVYASALGDSMASTDSYGVASYATGGTNNNYGVYGYGNSFMSGTNYGVYGAADTAGYGVYGIANDWSAVNYGVYGTTNSSNGWAGYFTGGQGLYADAGVIGSPTGGYMGAGTLNAEQLCIDGDCESAWPSASPGGLDTYVQFNDGGSSFGGDSGFTWDKINDYLYVASRIGIGTAPSYPLHVSTTGTTAAYATASGDVGFAFYGTTSGANAYTVRGYNSNTGYGGYFDVANAGTGVKGVASLGSGTNYGVEGTATSGYGGYFNGSVAGAYGFSASGYGVWGGSTDSYAVYGNSTNSFGGFLSGLSGVYGNATSGTGWAGYFTGGYGLYTDNDLYVGATAETIDNAGFTMDGSGAGFFLDQIGAEGNIYTDDGAFIVGETTTYGDGSITTSASNLTINPAGGSVFITDDNLIVDTNTLYVNATSNYVGIGISPSYPLHVSTTESLAAYATSSATNGFAFYGVTSGASSYAVRGYNTNTGYGGYFDVNGTSSTGVYGAATAGSGTNYGVQGNATSGYGGAFVGSVAGAYGNAVSGYGFHGNSTNSVGVYGTSTNSFGGYFYGATAGAYGSSTSGYGVQGISTNSQGVYGNSTNSDGGRFIGATYGVYGYSVNGTAAVYGDSSTGYGVYGNSVSGYGVYGISTNTYAGYFTGGSGIYVSASGGYAGYFAGGNVGIGTTPSYTLDVSSTGARAINAITSNTSGTGVYGSATATTGQNYGGFFRAAGDSLAVAVYGQAQNSGAVQNYGGYFRAEGAGAAAAGVYGEAAGAADVYGVQGVASGTGAIANIGGRFTAAGNSGAGVYGSATATTGQNYGGYFQAAGSDGAVAVYGQADNPGAYTNYGGYFRAEGAGAAAAGVYGEAAGDADVYGVQGHASSNGNYKNYGGYFTTLGTGTGAAGVYGEASGAGVVIGVHGYASNSGGVLNYGGYFASEGSSAGAAGVYGYANGTGNVYGVQGEAAYGGNVKSYGGYFKTYGYGAGAAGVYGEVVNGGSVYGVQGKASNAGAVTSYGGYFTTAGTGTEAAGVYGEASGTAGGLIGVRGKYSGGGAVASVGGYFTSNSTAVGTAGVYGEATASANNVTGVYGSASGTGAVSNIGGWFNAAGQIGVGVYGTSSYNSTATTNYGGYFLAKGQSGIGVYGEADYSTAYSVNYGGKFKAAGDGGYGVYGEATDTGASSNYGGYFLAAGNGGSSGVKGVASGNGTTYAVYGDASYNGAVNNYGGYFQAAGTNGARGVYGYAYGASGTNYGVYGEVVSGWAGYFTGGSGLYVSGTASQMTGASNGPTLTVASTSTSTNTIALKATWADSFLTTTDGGPLKIISTTDTGYTTTGDAATRRVGLIQVDANVTSASGGNFIAFNSDVNGTSDAEFRVSMAGATYADGAYSSAGADLAEIFDVSDLSLDVGDLVVVDNATDVVTKSSIVYQEGIVGIVTDASLAGFIGRNPDGEIGPDQRVISMIGRMSEAKVNDENGVINPGDLLTSSSTAGVAMKATKPGMVVGRALEGWSGPGQGTIIVYVNPGWHAGGTIVTDGTVNFFDDNFTFNKVGTATDVVQGYDSKVLTLIGSGWDGAAAQDVGMKIYNKVTDATHYRLSVVNNAGDEIASINDNGTMRVANRLLVGNKFFPADPSGIQNDYYIFYGANYMRTNASGWSTGSFDFAEMFKSDEALEAGDLVSVDGETNEYVKKSTGTYDSMLVGIVSTEPGFLGGVNVDFDNPVPDQGYPIALAGRVPTKVSVENGPIVPGDPLTASSIPGVAMRATEPGMVIGVALEGWNNQEVGKIKVFVNLSWYGVSGSMTPTSELASLDLTGNLNMNGNYILNVAQIVGKDEKWVIDEEGVLKVKLVSEDATEKEMFGLTSAEVELTLSGAERLENGQKLIDLTLIDEEFVKNISTETPLKILITPAEEMNGVYIAERNEYSFRVKELNSGTSNAAFDWLVIARRRGYEDPPPEESMPTPEPAPSVPSPSPSPSPEPPPSEPPPSEPPPSEPPPSEPAPSEPAPSEPAPSEPAPSEPAPSEPAPSEPAPSEPAPIAETPSAPEI